MSLLAPFYLLGALAVAGPIIFHFLRKVPSGQLPFSTLMFLEESQPRTTKKSTVEHWPLLLLRALIIGLLATAFARPFLRKLDLLTENNDDPKIKTLVVDCSASMQPDDLQVQSEEIITQWAKDIKSNDYVSIWTFGSQPQMKLGFEGMLSAEPDSRKTLVEDILRQIKPEWGTTDTGLALASVVEYVDRFKEELTLKDGESISTEITLISDFQKGSRLDDLRKLNWPEGIELQRKPVTTESKSNVTVALLAKDNSVDDKASKDKLTDVGNHISVRLTNSKNAEKENFKLFLVGEDIESEKDIYIPAGNSVTQKFKLKDDYTGHRAVVLLGDDLEFDNIAYVAPLKNRKRLIAYFGEDDPRNDSQAYFYLKQAMVNAAGLAMEAKQYRQGDLITEEDIDSIDFAVLNTQPTEQLNKLVEKLLAENKPVLLLTNRENNQLINSITNSTGWDVKDSNQSEFSMISYVDFEHPIFVPFAEPPFRDFSKIRILNQRAITPPKETEIHSLLKTDNGTPLLFKIPTDEGQLFALNTTWARSDSQLALSSKFIGILYGFVNLSPRGLYDSASALAVTDSIPKLSQAEKNMESSLHLTSLNFSDVNKFDWETKLIDPEKDILRPGVLSHINEVMKDNNESTNSDSPEKEDDNAKDESKEQTQSVQENWTVYLPARESLITESEEELFAGLSLSSDAATSDLSEEEKEATQYLQIIELEKKQKLWQWLIIAGLLLLIIEISYSDRLARRDLTEKLVS